MKKVIEYILLLGLTALFVFALMRIIFNGKFSDDENRTGLLESIGVFSVEEDADIIDFNDYTQDLHEIEIQYAGLSKTLSLRTTMNLKSLFEVKSSASESFVSGDNEDTFQLYIKDICLKSGTSIYDEVIKNIEESSDENSNPLYYNPETGEIIFYTAGVYKFEISVNDVNGQEVIKTFNLVADDYH